MKKTPHKWTEEQMNFVKEHYTNGKYSRKEVAELINKKFDLDLTDNQIQTIVRRLKIKGGRSGRFVKGHTTWNKGVKGLRIGGEVTWFKKGHTPLNYRPIGSERTDRDGYILIKVRDDGPTSKHWRKKQQVIWEQYYGTVPHNHVVIFLDGNKLNFSIENLALINRQDLLNMNRYKLFSDNIETTKSGVLVAKIYTRISDLNSKERNVGG